MDTPKSSGFFGLLLNSMVIPVSIFSCFLFLIGEGQLMTLVAHGQNMTASNQTLGDPTIQGSPFQQSEQLQTYENSSLGIKIQYSPEWTLDPPDDLLPTRIGFSIDSAELGYPTLYVDVFKNMGLEGLKHMVEPLASDLDGPVQSYPIEFKGNPAQVLHFNWSASYENHLMSDPNAPPEKMTNFEVLTSKDNNSYLLVYSAKREGNNNNNSNPFNQFFPIAQKMILSFDITNLPNQSVPEDSIAPFCRYTPGSCI